MTEAFGEKLSKRQTLHGQEDDKRIKKSKKVKGMESVNIYTYLVECIRICRLMKMCRPSINVVIVMIVEVI